MMRDAGLSESVGSHPRSEEGSDTIWLSREAQWSEVGQTAVIARGQKTWMIGAGDIGLLDVSTLTLGSERHE